MKKFRFLLLVVLCFTKAASLPALEEDADFFNMEASKDEEASFSPLDTFSLNELSTFVPQIPKVNVITGEYCEDACDLVVAGIEPLSYRRFYEHTGYKDQAYGHWRINPETLFLFNFERVKRKKKGNIPRPFASIGEENGSMILYEKNTGNKCSLDSSTVRCFTNGSSLTGQNHPLNTKIFFRRHLSSWQYGKYDGVVENGDGRKRHFSTRENFYFPTEGMSSSQGFLTEERKPNGNIIYYNYIDFKGRKKSSPLYVLKSITAYNSSKTKILGSIDIHYSRSEHSRNVEQIYVTGSDGRKAILNHCVREVQRKKKVREWLKGKSYTRPKIVDIVLGHVETPSKPTQSYNYRWEKAKYYFDHPYMFYAGEPEGRILETIYDLKSKKVTAQNAPVGPNGEMCPIASYEYKNDHTVVYDGENQKTIYRYNDDKRITAVEKYDADQLIQVERSEWDSSNGNLIRKQIENGSGYILHVSEYEYDKNHNVIEERIGDGKSGDTIRRTFSKDSFNLKLTESDRPGKRVRYTYIPNTNLLSSEITYEHDRIVKRIFHFYDDEISSVRIKTIVDDGHSNNPYDLAHVTYRKILEIQPKREIPCVGFPEEVQEKTLDCQGNEILLKKVRYTYHPSGKIEREHHYDAKDVYRYSIINKYDEKERLIATTDALGSKTNFTYDANFNLVSQDGPRSDIHKEWSYDKVNRPIEEKEWQSDGTILVSEKKYDKCSRLIAQIDPCGFETHYEYNALGQLTAIVHPDGAIERKEYDALGDVIAETDPNGYVIRKEYNFRGQPTAIYYPNGQEEHFTYNPTGTIATHIDKNGAKTCYTYDIFDHPTQIKTYSSSGELLKTTTSTYTPFCKLSETDSEGITTTYTYDFCGRKVAEQTGDKITRYSYDRLGRLTKTDHQDFQTLETYDHADQLISKKIVSQDLQFQEEYAYDPAGNRTHLITSQGAYETLYNTFGKPLLEIDPLNFATTYAYRFGMSYTEVITDANGIKTLYTHDPRGHIQEVSKKNTKGAFIAKTYYAYDPNGNLAAQTHVLFDGPRPGRAITHHWEYGPMGRLERFLEAGEKETRYLYDAKGRLSTIVKPSGIELHHEWDDLGRLKRYYASDFDYTYTYDRNDRLLSVYDAVSQTQTSRTYDALGNLIQETLANGLKLANTYDDQGRRIELTLPDDSTINYVYKGAYLYQVSRKGNIYAYVSRDLEGNLLQADFPSGQITITRDPLSRWQGVDSAHYSAHFPKDAYDPVGNLLCYTYRDVSGTVECAYQYDAYDQLISENAHTYHFDSLHNRMEKDGLAHQVNHFCQTVHDGHTTYGYDPDGNLISDGKWHYDYDSQGRLITLENESMYIEYAYDPFHRRLSKTVFSNGQSHHQEYIWDGDNEIGALSEGELTQLRVLGEGFGAEIGAAVFYELNGETYVPIHDHRGGVVALADTAGKAIENYRYTAFGEELTENHLSPWRFSSKRVEEETGLVFFGRRYYFPELGKWITQDPEGFKDGPNLYAYLKNCPLADFDPYGLWSMRETWNKAQHFMWGMLEGSGYHFYNMASSFGRDFSSTNTWQPRSLLSNQDLAVSARGMDWVEQSTLPFTYEARRLGSDVSQLDTMRARGRAFGEQAITLGGLLSAWNVGKRALNTGARFQNATRMPVPQELTRDYLFSGQVKTPQNANSGRSKNWLQPNAQAEGAHSVFRRDPTTGQVNHYATYWRQTNPYDPKPWELFKRYDGIGKSHRNKYFKELIETPHIHDPYYPGGIRPALLWEIPKVSN